MNARRGRGLNLGHWLAPPRFVMFVAVCAIAFAALWRLELVPTWQEAAALGFDLAAALFLVSLIPLLRDGSAKTIRQHAQDNDAGRGLVLGITVLLTVVVMAALVGEMPKAQQGDPWAMTKLVGTLVLVWAFANSVFTMHYSHAYYGRDPGTGKDAEGIDFPGTDCPDYGDFAYFAFTLGMTFQTSDVAITAPMIRRVALLHSIAGFVFNIGVVAFTINALGGGK